MRLAKLVYLAIPGPQAGDSPEQAMAQAGQSRDAYRAVVCTLFPELTDDQAAQEAELAKFLKEFAGKPLELRISQDPRGNMDIALKR